MKDELGSKKAASKRNKQSCAFKLILHPSSFIPHPSLLLLPNHRPVSLPLSGNAGRVFPNLKLEAAPQAHFVARMRMHRLRLQLLLPMLEKSLQPVRMQVHPTAPIWWRKVFRRIDIRIPIKYATKESTTIARNSSTKSHTSEGRFDCGTCKLPKCVCNPAASVIA